MLGEIEPCEYLRGLRLGPTRGGYAGLGGGVGLGGSGSHGRRKGLGGSARTAAATHLYGTSVDKRN